MTTVTITAKVTQSCGAYNCAMHKKRGSSTMNAETAVRRAAEKYAKAAGLVMVGVTHIAGPDFNGRDFWKVTLESAQMNRRGV